MRQYVQDRIISAVGLVLVGLGLWVCHGYPNGSALFPETCLIVIGILLLLLAIESIFSQRKSNSSGDTQPKAVEMEWGPFFLVTLTLAVYGFFVEYLGFYTASALLMLTVGFLWGGVKKTTIILTTICLLIFLYACFTVLFNVPLPTGIMR